MVKETQFQWNLQSNLWLLVEHLGTTRMEEKTSVRPEQKTALSDEDKRHFEHAFVENHPKYVIYGTGFKRLETDYTPPYYMKSYFVHCLLYMYVQC